jgi:Ca2+-binding RTX toxin-like protein
MAIYLPRSLVGTDNDDVLTNAESYVGDGNVDVYLAYSSIYGMGGNDVISVTSDRQVQFIDGGSGNDTITDNTDHEGTVHGGDDNDTINYVNEFRTSQVFGDAGDDTVTYEFSVHNRGSRLDGGEGVDTLVLGGDFDSAWVSNFEILKTTRNLNVRNGQLSAFESVDVQMGPIVFSKAADISGVHFAEGTTTIRLVGSSSKDNFDLSDQTRNFSIDGKGGDDTIISGAGRLFADGGGGIDFLQGGDGDDVLKAGKASKEASDLLETVFGKGGDDVVYFSGSRGVYDGGEGEDTLHISGSLHDATESRGGSIAANFEHLIVSATRPVLVDLTFFEQFDTIKGSRVELQFTSAVALDHMPDITGRDFSLIGSAGNDRMVLTSTSRIAVLGEGGDDFLRATTHQAFMAGGAGNDKIIGSIKADTILGGSGNDSLQGGDGNDSIDGGRGLDIVRGGNGDDTLHMGNLKSADHQTIYGDAGNDRFVYGAGSGSDDNQDQTSTIYGNLILSGGKGGDLLVMSGHIDKVQTTGIETLRFYDEIWVRPDFLSGFKAIEATLLYNNENNIHFTTAGNWTWSGGFIDAHIFGTKGVDILDFSKSTASVYWASLGAGNDVIRFGGVTSSDSAAWGDVGNDTAYSGNGSDEFTGAQGADRFIAGEGNDTFYGGLGHDVYVAADNTGVDLFDDFEAKGASSDVIDLSGVSDITDFADLKANHLKTSGLDIYIDMGAQGKLYINHSIDIADLTEANFLF